MNDVALWSWDLVWQALPELLIWFVRGTLLVTVVGTAIATVLGLIIAMVRRTAPRPIAGVLTFCLNFIRMTPIVMQLMFIYFGFPTLDPLAIGIGVFGVHYSTYMAEVYRAGIESIPGGQWEASTALSMSRGRTWVAVIIPQAVRATVPALGNYAISMFKDTPFLVVISVLEMVTQGMTFAGNHFHYVEVLTLCGVIFLAASYPTSLLVGRLEKRLALTN